MFHVKRRSVQEKRKRNKLSYDDAQQGLTDKPVLWLLRAKIGSAKWNGMSLGDAQRLNLRESFLMANRFNVQVTWDGEAEMWVADSDDIPGLAAEAPDDKALWKKLETLIPELLTLNHVRLNPKKDIEIVLNFHPRKARIQSPKAA